jgi:anaerobic selenocysteine-containing dehydrogenase/NAD-dependent dihydropyrimidine dehydrogenase PreA subunit
VVEPTYTITGQMADHRIRLSSSQVETFLIALIAELRSQGLAVADKFPDERPDSIKPEWLNAIAKDLLHHSGKSLVVPGRRQPANVHRLSAAINSLLNNVGRTVEYRPLQDCFPTRHSLEKLQQAIKADELDTIVLLNVNPVYNHATDLDFAKLCQTRHVIHFSSYQDESAQTAEWHLPASHYLEYWGDVRDWNGLAAVIQPLIRPLYNTHSDIELLHLLMTGTEVTGYQLVRDTWRSLLATIDFENAWKRILFEGFFSEPSGKTVYADLGPSSNIFSNSKVFETAMDSKKFEFVFQPSFSLFDGRHSNNAWLQELPDPITKIAWDSVAVISRKAALELDLDNGDVIQLDRNGITISLPVWIMPGQADRTITLTMGYGRLAAGQLGSNIGANVFKLRTNNQEYITCDIAISKTEKKHILANAQEYGYTLGRPLVRETTLQEYQKNPKFAQEMVEHPPLKSLWKEHEYTSGYQWGMVIDLNVCNGCSACVIACQSENNIPIVGKEQVANGREMHWIRLDRYFSGEHDDAEMVH